MAKVNKKSFTKALVSSGGNQSLIAGRLEVTRGAVHQFLAKNQDMRELLETEAEEIIDVAEKLIDYDIRERNSVDSAKWKLTNSKRGKSRGYGIKQEIEHSGEAVKIEVKIPKEVAELIE